MKEVVSQNDWPDYEIHLPNEGQAEVLATKNPRLSGKQQCQHNVCARDPPRLTFNLLGSDRSLAYRRKGEADRPLQLRLFNARH